jgi:hypothetical protein
MKKILLTMLLASATFAHAGWYYWDHGRLMWTNKYGYVEDVAQVEQEERDQELPDKQAPRATLVKLPDANWNNVCTP